MRSPGGGVECAGGAFVRVAFPFYFCSLSARAINEMGRKALSEAETTARTPG